MNKKKICIAASIFCLAVMIFVIVIGSLDGIGAKSEFKVGKYPITQEHFQIYLDDNIARVTSYFYNKYQADSNQDGFWNKSFEGENPQEVLERDAKKQLVRDTVIRIEAKKRGIQTDIILEDIKKSMEAENQRRAAGKEIIYGPNQYTLIQYISKTQDTVEDSLKEVLLETDLKPTQEQLKEVYNSIDPSLIDMGCKAKVGAFLYSGMKVGQFPKELEAAWLTIKEQWDQKVDPTEIVKQIKETTGLELSYDEVEYDTNDLPKDANQLYWLVDSSRSLPVGSATTVLNYEASQGMFIMLEKEDFGQATFEASYQLLVNKWINDSFEEFIEEMIQTNYSSF